MSSDMYRRELERKRKQRIDAEKKAGQSRSKETEKRSAASKARSAASKATSETTARSKLREAERHEQAAASAGKDASRWQEQASRYAREEATASSKLARAEQSEVAAAEARRKREQERAEHTAKAARVALERRVEGAETMASVALRELRAPKVEKLRILLLGAASLGDLRIGREQKRIRVAVQSALHRDYVEIDARPSATTADLLDGITRFRPHVVHFSGHGADDLIVFEDDNDEPHEGFSVSAEAFADAVVATDTPPLVVLLNSCNSASQLPSLVEALIPFAIGMTDEIEDVDAITYAAQFYAAVANGQSIDSAHRSARAALKLAGLTGAELPELACAPDVDPATTVLVRPWSEVASADA